MTHDIRYYFRVWKGVSTSWYYETRIGQYPLNEDDHGWRQDSEAKAISAALQEIEEHRRNEAAEVRRANAEWVVVP